MRARVLLLRSCITPAEVILVYPMLIAFKRRIREKYATDSSPMSTRSTLRKLRLELISGAKLSSLTP